MKINKKFLIGILAISMACIILQPNRSNAALQSNGGTPAKKNLSTWMLQIRQMQELGGSLGRTDTINTTDLTSNATDLDIHMEKNTEYGAMVILSASAYGNPNPIVDGETTTGNSTGIVMNINYERVAAGSISTSVSNFNTGVVERYKNIYDGMNFKIGDVMAEFKWHGGLRYWAADNWYTFAIVRSHSGSIFSYYAYIDGNNPGGTSAAHPSRAAIVVGTGI